MRLQLPVRPGLAFQWTDPGSVEANTTIVVPVLVSQVEGRRRRSSECSVGLAVYQFECGGTQYRTIGLQVCAAALHFITIDVTYASSQLCIQISACALTL